VNAPLRNRRIELRDGATVAVIGGGPGGAFFTLHLLRKAREMGRPVQVMIFERHCPDGLLSPGCPMDGWKGCNHCAGGLSAHLNDALMDLGLKLPAELIQSRIRFITIQGFWKNIELEVPPGRVILSIYRGSRPSRRPDRHASFDRFLLREAIQRGAKLINGNVTDVRYAGTGKPVLLYQANAMEQALEADLVVFAAGVNQEMSQPTTASPMLRSLRSMVPEYVPPRLRRAAIMELQALPKVPGHLSETIHFVEYGSRNLPLEMCSLVPKRGFVTVVLVGAGVDAVLQAGDRGELIRRFLGLPHIRKLLSPETSFVPACFCCPNLVVGEAKHPFGDRVAVVGDMVAARLYKDGILSASRTARALAETVLEMGIDTDSLGRGYGPLLRRFSRDNRFARLVFLLHRMVFGSSVLSRVPYQAVIAERKSTPAAHRHLENILWRIASGDDSYENIFRAMLQPATLWSVLTRGVCLTFRNSLTELCLGLRWEGFGRFTTGVAVERLDGKRQQFSRLTTDAHVPMPARPQFERMYTIRIVALHQDVLDHLQRFGEADREYLRPAGIRIRRVAGQPGFIGCLIRYEIFCRPLCFHLSLEQVLGGHLLVFRVMDGFARGGALIFEIEELPDGVCDLSIYVAFDFRRGSGWIGRPFWWLFAVLFPGFIHDVIWNHSLCQFKDVVEKACQNRRARVAAPNGP
jgi:flavin-dependent dehydrogenase